MCDVHVVWNSH